MKKKIAFSAAMLLTVLTLAAQGVKVVSPNGGESWALNSTQRITWTFQNAGSAKVDIILRSGGGKVGVIKSQVALNAGTWTWASVGKLENGAMVAVGADYIVRIRDLGNTFSDDSDTAFVIASAAPVIRQFPDRLLPRPLPLGGPKLAVTAIDLVRSASGYSVIFGYKNAGNTALPRRHELTVKPDYRVLIDGREVDQGDLFIPESPPAGPGWEMTTHAGGFINFPVSEPRPWHIGKEITIVLNERNALNMGQASKTSSLLPIVLARGYDLAFAGPATIDWNANRARVVITKVGSSPQLSKGVALIYKLGYYHTNTVSGGPGEATVTYPEGPYQSERSVKIPITGPFPYRLDIPMEPSPYYELDFRIAPEQRDEFDERNNTLARARFERPGAKAGPRIHALAFSTRADSRGKPTQLRTIITLLNETDRGVNGMRLVLKRNGSLAEEWKGISLSAGQKQLYINYGALPGPPLYSDMFQAYLYDSAGALLDSRSENE